MDRFTALLLIYNLPYWLQERAKYLHLWQGRNKLMDQLPVSGRCVPSQGSEEICNRSDFCYSGRHWTVNVFFISGWAGLCSLANQVRAVHSRLASPATSHQPPPTQSRIKSFGSFRCGTELCCSAPTVWRGCSRRSDLLNQTTLIYLCISVNSKSGKNSM